jgi:hypothetical protein
MTSRLPRERAADAGAGYRGIPACTPFRLLRNERRLTPGAGRRSGGYSGLRAMASGTRRLARRLEESEEARAGSTDLGPGGRCVMPSCPGRQRTRPARASSSLSWTSSRSSAPRPRAAAYVAALLRLAVTGDDRIRVVLTIRRDYLYACDSFPDLSERLYGASLLRVTYCTGCHERAYTRSSPGLGPCRQRRARSPQPLEQR